MIPFGVVRWAPGRGTALALAVTLGAAALMVPGTASAGPLAADFSTTDSGILDPTFTTVITHVDDTPNTSQPASSPLGSLVVFTGTVDNEGKAPAHDMLVELCTPDGIEFLGFSYYPAGLVGWDHGSTPDCPGGLFTIKTHDDRFNESSFSYEFDAVVTGGPVGEVVGFTSILTAYETPDVPGVERVAQEWSSTASVRVTGPSVGHTVTPASAVIGDTVTFTITVTLPGGHEFPSAYVRERIPAGVKVTDTRVSSDDGVSLTAPPTPATEGTTEDVLDWSSGGISAEPTDRTIVIEVDGVIIDDLGEDEVVSSASLHWERSQEVGYLSWKTYSFKLLTDATVTVLEPSLSVEKTVNGVGSDQVRLGDVFDYEVTVSNADTPSTSTAFGATVVDTIPPGVVVDRASITGGGVASPGSGVVESITWSVASLAPGEAVSLTYTASFADSGVSAGDSLTGEAEIQGYFSLPADHENADSRRTYTGSGSGSSATVVVMTGLALTGSAGAGVSLLAVMLLLVAGGSMVLVSRRRGRSASV